MRILLVCSHGGHLTETMRVLAAFEGQECFFATYHSARDADVERLGRTYFMENIGLNPFRMARAFVWAFAILRREHPDVIVSFGAEIALPFFYIGKLMKKKVLFIESWCRVEDLSLTGRLVYPIADQFWVQWPQLVSEKKPKLKYYGSVI